MPHLDTEILHADMKFSADSAITPSIPFTATFVARDAQEFAEMASTPQHSRYYTRYGNPLHERIGHLVARLEGAESGLCFSSGMGGIAASILSQVKAGDHVVAQNNHYMATSKIMTELLPRFGVQTTLVDQTDVSAFAAAMQPNTRLIHLETPANPTMALTDLAGVCALAKAAQALVSCDNTFASPINQKPMSFGVDIVMHSATKYLSGHHDITAGVVVASKALCEQIWHTAITLGATQSPFDAWLLLRSLRTLPIRVRQHNATALSVATFLEGHPGIERVFYPGLPSHPQFDLARKQMTGFGGVMSVWVRGDYARTTAFVSRLNLFRHAVSLGGVESLAVHAAAMWAGTMNDAQMQQAQIQPNAVRLSIGLEAAEDLQDDLSQALA
ncbi:MAG: methionine gamma-lyase [Rhizobiales bacterium PAR1]|nr:MAG: methionine gamma-lyase [Rhizobiales bacterium PAR1]